MSVTAYETPTQAASRPSCAPPGFGPNTRTPTRATQPVSREVLSFRLGKEEYALDILRVQEIRGYEQALPIVGTPPHIKGVVNLRGVIVPIVDMRLRFGLPEANFDAMTVTIVLNIGTRVIGVVVDGVHDVINIPTDQIKAAPEFSGAVDSRHITGIATMGEGDARRMLILLDVDTLLGSEGLL